MRATGLLAGGIAAIAFAVLFVAGFLLTTDTPDGDESNLKWVRYYADSGNRRMIIIGAILMTLSAVAFLIFPRVLRERLRTAAPGSEWLDTVVFASGIAFVAMRAAMTLGLGSVAAGIAFGDNPVPRDADIMRNLESVAFGALFLFGAAFAGLLVFTTSIVSGRAALMPRWLVVTGYVVGVPRLPRRLALLPDDPVRAVDAGRRHRHARTLGSRGVAIKLMRSSAPVRGGSGSGRGAAHRRRARS